MNTHRVLIQGFRHDWDGLPVEVLIPLHGGSPRLKHAGQCCLQGHHGPRRGSGLGMQALRKRNHFKYGIKRYLKKTYIRSVIRTHKLAVSSIQPATHFEEFPFS